MDQVKLVAITQPRIKGIFSAEEFIAYAAKVSNPANQLNTMTAPRLMRYLVKNHHWSPFEMVQLTLEINTTRDIGRQILRHRSFSFQEFSQRYADVSVLGEMFVEPRETRFQDTKNRQNSIAIKDLEGNDTMTPAIINEEWYARQQSVIDTVKDFYTWAIKNGIAKEQARVVLPEGLTKTRMYMAGTLRSWIHYCALRCANGTQKEHQDIAIAAWQVITNEFPSLTGILEDVSKEEEKKNAG